jgi:hypothetical protein
MEASAAHLLLDVCAEGDDQVVGMLIDGGAHLDITDRRGCTPLHRACYNGRGSIVTMLIDGGAALNVTDIDGYTPLHRACQWGHESVVTMLIDGGADINVTNGRGCTPLHAVCSVVVYRNRIYEALLEIIRVLILNGADTQARDSQSRLPVEILQAEDHQSRTIYEEAVEEMKYGDLKPVLK